MKYKRIWIIESKPIREKGSWSPADNRWFYTRKEAKDFMEKRPVWFSENAYWAHRISKFMGPITSGIIREV